MAFYLEEPSYTFYPTPDNNLMGYTFDAPFIPFPTEDSFDSFLYPFSSQSLQLPVSSMVTRPTFTIDDDSNFGINYTSQPTSSAMSPIPSEKSDIESPSSEATSPRTSLNELDMDNGGPTDLHKMGYVDVAGNWRCRYTGCSSSRVFLRACDLRKHFRGHAKYFFCTEKRCQRTGVGFATRKDFQRHMGSHKPTVRCLHPDCDRIFSRKDNMREHYKKIHQRLRNNLFPRRCRRTKKNDSQQAVSQAPTCSS
ncbi:C2H2 transcription factor [Colletotrichum truncatum]|uniref:C2H2 transcription factor n=1 Tax=Colletotrichum truncatum TaxID=5467 RepID=A0ACC3ZK97_COLTU|nr:C2H2 transcription factor [Colletotrichum truncatum]KAF6799931.1 C2H2 transcription factor [Colletotrichum truncatum]